MVRSVRAACASFVLVAAILLAYVAPVRADLPRPKLTRLFPCGGGVGTTIEVNAEGADTEDATQLRFEQPGLVAVHVEGRKFKVTIAADVPEGTYEARLVGKYGVSQPHLFAVTTGLLDVLDKDPNNTPAEAQAVDINSCIHGQSDGNAQDCYRVALRSGQRVVFDCQAQRTDSPLDANLILAASDGRVVAASSDYYGRDPLIDFRAPADGDYIVTVHDLSYRAGFPYRLLVTTRPHLEAVFPRAVQAGQRMELLALGRNLPGGTTSAGVNDPPLDEVRFPIDIPGDLTSTGRFQWFDIPCDHSSQSSQVTWVLSGMQVRGPSEWSSVRPASVVVVNRSVTLEQEQNSAKDQAQKVELPATIAGRFDVPRDADWYTFQVGSDGAYYVDVYAERLGARADPFVAVYDKDGNVVSELDDYGHRVRALDGHLRDPYGQINLHKDKPYFLLIQDRYSRGGARYQYVLSVTGAEPDFQVNAMYGGYTAIRAGGTEFFDVVVDQRGGFNSPIKITAEGLPAGVKAHPCILSSTIHGQFVIEAEANAPMADTPIRLWATGTYEGREIRREVKFASPLTTQNGCRPMRELVLSVREQAPFVVRFDPPQVTIESGKSAEVKVTVQRLWSSFTGPVDLVSPNVPGYFQIGNQTIPAGQTELKFNVTVNGGVSPGEYTTAIWAQAQVPFTKQPDKEPAKNTLVMLPTTPLVITVPMPAK